MGHLPPRCSVNMAIKRSTEPKIALWMITGLSCPLFKGYYRIKIYPKCYLFPSKFSWTVFINVKDLFVQPSIVFIAARAF